MNDELLSRIEDAGINASAPPQQLWMDGWLLRLSPGKAKRARCINAVAVGRLSVEEKLRRAQQVFDEAGLPLVVRITPFSLPAGLDRHLDDIGLQVMDDTRVMASPLDGLESDAEPLPQGCSLWPAEAHDYAEVIGRLRGSTESQRRAHAERLSTSPVPYRGWLLQRGGRTLACGQYAREGDLVGLYDVFTEPAERGRGLSALLCRHLLREAQGQGARTAYLQVDASNAPARKVYQRLGFADAYAYHYRTADPAAAG
jgi:GNAT superfamily N-acetyltransferase